VVKFTENRLGRQLAFQFLFGLEFTTLDWQVALPEFWAMEPVALTRGSLEQDESFTIEQEKTSQAQFERARQFAGPLIAGVCEQQALLDAWIAEALDNWRPERVGRIEWIILRLALYEMNYCPGSPDTVVIAEAIRLATMFGDTESPRFINGLLNRFLERKREAPESAEMPDTRPPDGLG